MKISGYKRMRNTQCVLALRYIRDIIGFRSSVSVPVTIMRKSKIRRGFSLAVSF